MPTVEDESSMPDNGSGGQSPWRRRIGFNPPRTGKNVSKPKMPPTLELVRGTVVLGTIQVKPGDSDFPWYSGVFQPAPGFGAVRDLFDQELRLLRENTTDDSAQWDEWEAVHAELHEPGLRLQAPDSSYAAHEILIHIDGSEAWWRSE
jgi:hypothetical protein